MRKGQRRILTRPVFNSERPVREELAAHLRNLIASGAIGQDARMPAQRSLAKDFGVSRNSITAAYEQLCGEGVLETRKGAGTFVSARRQSVRALAKPTAPERELPLRQGILDLDLFPRDTWRRLQERTWRSMPSSVLGYNDTAGWPELRLVLAQRAWATRGVRRSAENVFVCTSSSSALQLVCKALQLARKEVVVECPGYVKIYSTLRACGARLRPAGVDDEGLLAPSDFSPAAVIVTPTVQFPMGQAMSAARRAQLLTWSRAALAWIIEDDYEADFRFEGEALPALAAAEDSERVLYLSSLNSVMFPSLQIAALIVPDALVDIFRRAIENTKGSTNTTAQVVTHEFINGGHLAAHIRRSIEVYSERRVLLRSLLQSELGGAAHLRAQPTGLHVTLQLQALDDGRIEETALARNLVVHSLRSAGEALQMPVSAGLYMGFAAYPEAAIKRAVFQLARIVEALSR